MSDDIKKMKLIEQDFAVFLGKMLCNENFDLTHRKLITP